MTAALEPTIAKPRKIVVPLPTALTWGGDENEYRYEEKLDGRFETRQAHGTTEDLGDTLLAGEYVRGEFYAFDLLRMNGSDFRSYPLHHRLAFLAGVFVTKPFDCAGGEIHPVPALDLRPSTLADIWARGGEGIVRKSLAGKWGEPMEACKRLETFHCLVTGMNAGQSVQLARIINGGEMRPCDPAGFGEDHFVQSLETAPCGAVKLGGGKADRVRVGSILKIEGFGLTREGKIREPRPCRDTATSWIVQY